MKLKIISDGTKTGTKLIDSETGQPVGGISQLTWEANSNDLLTKVTVELTNIPVEITSKAIVDLFEFNESNDYVEPIYSKSFEKDVKITAESPEGRSVLTTNARVFDAETNEVVGAVQSVTWTAVPDHRVARIKRVKFDNRDW